MRKVDLEHITDLVPAIESGTLNRSEIVSLFALIRDHAPKGSNIRDIGDAVVHKTRDQGASFKLLNKVADALLEVVIHGGEADVKMLYPIESVVTELANFYRSQGVTLDRRKALTNSRAFALSIGNMLDGTEVTLRSKSGTRIELHGGRSPGYAIFLAEDSEVTQLRAGDSIGGPMLISHQGAGFGLSGVKARNVGEAEFRYVT
ncbi:hypothetical protein [Microbacterium proteolyticum]|uniref:hypothetical protein n=1 Tax=Microbacterium proteolyticum TaxID=1572644 RepID=UPI0035BEC4F1